MKYRIKQIIILGLKQLKDPYYQGFAAEISFYLFLSIIPILLLLTQLLGFFQLSLEDAVHWVSQYTGKEVSGLLLSLIEFSPAGFRNVFYIVIALWSSSQAQFAIIRITNYTLKGGRHIEKGFLRERFRAILSMLITLFTMTFSLIILTYGDLLLQGVFEALDVDPDAYINNIWIIARWILGLALYFLMVSYNYYRLPSEKIPFKKVIPGSIFASVGMLLVTILFAKYTASVANYDILYGTLSTIITVLLWFSFIAWVLILGVLFNKVWHDTVKKASADNLPDSN